MHTLVPICLIVAIVGCTTKESAPPPQSPPVATTTTPVPPAGADAPVTSTEAAVAPEVNPPGDIPDTQAFVTYSSVAGGYTFDVPEGWARSEIGSTVTFVDKLDGVRMAVAPASTAPTVESVRQHEAKLLQSQGHAVAITGVADVNLPGGKAVLITYTSNSDPNPVTNRRVRLENESYLYFKNGREAMLTLWAPQGADNADQWKRMSRSVRWP